MNFVLNSKFSVEECIRKFKSNTRKSVFNSNSLTLLVTFWDFEKKYIFSNKGNNFKLERVYVRNIYRPIFQGRLCDIKGGTKIEGEIITHWSAKTFEVVWFSFAGIIGALMTAISVRDLLNRNIKSTDTFIYFFAPILLIIIGFFATKDMKQQAAQWRKEMIAFIENTLEVKKI